MSIEDTESRLHALDAEINDLRRRIWMVKHGLTKVTDPDVEIARLEADFDALGQRFVETYREWKEQHAAE